MISEIGHVGSTWPISEIRHIVDMSMAQKAISSKKLKNIRKNILRILSTVLRLSS